jgi:hypothetical protein
MSTILRMISSNDDMLMIIMYVCSIINFRCLYNIIQVHIYFCNIYDSDEGDDNTSNDIYNMIYYLVLYIIYNIYTSHYCSYHTHDVHNNHSTVPHHLHVLV